MCTTLALILGLSLAGVVESCIFTTNTDCSSLGSAQCIGLCDLFKHTGGDSWSQKDNWGQGDPCGGTSWHGVSCDSGVVYQINIGSNNLRGTIPPTLFAIATLRIL